MTNNIPVHYYCWNQLAATVRRTCGPTRLVDRQSSNPPRQQIEQPLLRFICIINSFHLFFLYIEHSMSILYALLTACWLRSCRRCQQGQRQHGDQLGSHMLLHEWFLDNWAYRCIYFNISMTNFRFFISPLKACCLPYISRQTGSIQSRHSGALDLDLCSWAAAEFEFVTATGGHVVWLWRFSTIGIFIAIRAMEMDKLNQWYRYSMIIVTLIGWICNGIASIHQTRTTTSTHGCTRA